jgi:protein tyrosine phosphatase (PTP) superfamily phosphohydrolase (DUF442 family)
MTSRSPTFSGAIAALLPVTLLLASCTGFHEVRPGVFRSPQPNDDQIARHVEDQGIRTIVCLRTLAPESAASARAEALPGITFWNVPMSATRLPRPATLLELWRVAAEAPRPMLLHCRAGVDRAGLASAIVVLHDTGDLAAARSQLAFLPHGHMAMLGTQAMAEVLDRYEPFHGRLPFPDWVQQVYAPEWEALTPLQRSR